MEWSERKKQILKHVVEDYIATAEPVGSKAVAQEMGGTLSSATVRNELAELVEGGYLEQPHTSAGRVPSPKGYRVYVNELMEQRPLSAQETETIDESLRGKLSALDGIVSQAGQLVNYPAYAVSMGSSALTVQRFELVPVNETSFIAVILLSNQTVKSQLRQLPLPVDDLPALSALLNAKFTRLPFAEIGSRMMGFSDQLPPERFLALSNVIEYTGEVIEAASHRDVVTAGAGQLLRMPEYRDLDRAQELMTFFVDNKEKLPVPEGDAPLQILIGPENINEALRDSSVVVASYDIGDGMRGLVGVVGPTRMDYATVTARLSYFADSLTRMFGKQQSLPPKEKE